MTISYPNGTKIEAIVLASTDERMRVALRGCRDSVEFTAGPDGTWIAESGEIVRVQGDAPQAATEALEEFLCPQDLIARLIGARDLACAAASGLM